ncbi:MAG: hypothetical protein DRP83_01360 [Planctomycetota bacterium]|nr:MAG: hypothetical protein DRP83_01360 [Planctomycetota bacterium]
MQARVPAPLDLDFSERMRLRKNVTKNYAVKVDIIWSPVKVFLGIVEYGHDSVAPGIVANFFSVD